MARVNGSMAPEEPESLSAGVVTRLEEEILKGIRRPAQAAQMMRAHVTLLGEGLSDLLHFLRSFGEHGLLTEIS